jgi:hypothetical protein
MTVNTRVIKILLHTNDMPYVEIETGLRVQVLPDMSYLPRCQKHQFAAFIADKGLLVVWEDQPKKLLQRAEVLQQKLMKMVWGNKSAYPEENEEKVPEVEALEVNEDPENQQPQKPRRIVLIQSFLTAITLMLTITALGSGWREIAVQTFVDRNYIRAAFILVAIPQIWLALVRLLCPIFYTGTDIVSVLLSSFSWKRRTTHWADWSNEREHEVLLWKSPCEAQP